MRLCPTYKMASQTKRRILFKKLLATSAFKEEGRDCILYEKLQRRDKVITILFGRFKVKKSYEK